jgi:hypothetical protein
VSTALDIALTDIGVWGLAAIGAGFFLLRQGGGLQVKAPPVPKKTAEKPGSDAAASVPDIADIAAKRGTG